MSDFEKTLESMDAQAKEHANYEDDLRYSRYLDEQAYRYNNRRDMGDIDRFKLAASQIVGKRLTWNDVT